MSTIAVTRGPVRWMSAAAVVYRPVGPFLGAVARGLVHSRGIGPATLRTSDDGSHEGEEDGKNC
jgi:hypothetical protein